jgi:hypothetical protein
MKKYTIIISVLLLISPILIWNQKCDLVTHMLAVDNVQNNQYSLIVTLATDKSCNIVCQMDNKEIEIRMIDRYQFSNRQYHIFNFNNLKQFQKYVYKCGEFSQITSFMKTTGSTFTITFPKNSKSLTKIATFGDWSRCEDGIEAYNFLSKNILAKNYDALVTLGDYAYNLTTENGEVGNDFLQWISPITSYLPFMVTAGNHEFKDGDFLHYINRFNMPQKSENKNLFFSFDINNIHFISIPSELALHNYKGKDFIEKFKMWFNEDAKKSTQKWKIVYMHRPIYCSWMDKPRCSSEGKKLRKLFEPLFVENKIDLVIGGHLHCYERSLPVYQGKVDIQSVNTDQNSYKNPNYPVYVICGSAGNREGHCPKCNS